MKIIFFGTGDFAIPTLEALLNCGHNVLSVVTQPDRPKGRHLKLAEPCIKATARKLNLPVYQPENPNEKKSTDFLKNLEPDLFVVETYGRILTKNTLSIPKIFSINVHASLLPKYRGAAPINWAIINGETKTGITIIKMNEFMDRGEIILMKDIDILASDNAISLAEKLSRLGAKTLVEAVAKIEDNFFSLTTQDETKSCLAPKLKKDTGRIDWRKTATDINNLVKGLITWPGAFTYYKGKILKIYKSDVLTIDTEGAKPGEIVKILKDALHVATAKNILLIKELQLESSKRMAVSQFISGHSITIKELLG